MTTEAVVLWLAPLPSTGWCFVYQPGDAPACRAAPTGLVPSGGRHQPCFVPRMRVPPAVPLTALTRHDAALEWRGVRPADTAASAGLTFPAAGALGRQRRRGCRTPRR